MPVAVVDTRFRTPVGNVNASPASVKCYATGKAEPFFYSRLSKNRCIMHEEQNNAPVKAVQGNRQEVDFSNPEEKEKLKQFYLTQSRRLCPTVSVERPESQRLAALHHKIKHFIKALTNLDRPWENGMPEMQKACRHFFALQNSPRAECQKMFEEWTKWSDFLIMASSHRSFISQILQDYHRQLRDLEKLLGGKPSESAENVSDR